jgi:outer membrane murein-binding lipoprotein Lpp
MALEIKTLEMAWLKAETIADRTKSEALRAKERLDDTKQKVALVGTKEIVVLLTKVETTVETLRARHAAAERQANELFDRLQAAKSQGEVHA